MPVQGRRAAAAASLRIVGVDLSYGGHRVLRDVNLEVRPGEFFGFLGPSGCGKTSLLRLVAGFVRADRGRVELDGRDIAALPPWKRDVGMVFQSYALWPHMTVRRNVAFGLEERRLPRREVTARVDEALALVGLTHLADRMPSQLSGGQQQRVAVARTVAVRPRLLLLDEPLSNLDAKLRVQVRRDLRELQQALGLTTVFVTHDQEEANATCDRVAVLSDGTVQQVGTPMELYARPANLFVAGFLGTANALGGTVDGDGFVLPGGTLLPVPAGTTAGSKLVFRPQDAAIAAREDGIGSTATPGVLALPGRITRVEFLGAAIRYGVAVDGVVDGAEVAVDLPFRTGDQPYAPGTPVSVTVPTASAMWLPA